MSTLVVGASGATGKLLVEQLVMKGEEVKIIVRSIEGLPKKLREHGRISITEASLLEMSDDELLTQVKGCQAVVSCLGHNLSFKGMFGQPRQLVTHGLQRICRAIELTNPTNPVKYILMNTTGNQNKHAGEKVSLAQSLIVGLIRHLLPPHADNEIAASFLQSNFGHDNKMIQWTAVRPDSLIDEDSVTPYSTLASPTRSAIFDAGKTSRINVANFISELVLNETIWRAWKSKMPVIYNDIESAD
jgi:hypothetical protein